MSGPVPCRNCGQPVPRGRLACPACGTLVASVTSPLASPVVDAAPTVDPASESPDAERWSEPPPQPQPDPEPESRSRRTRARSASESESKPKAEPEPPAEPQAAGAGLDGEPEPEPASEAAPDGESTETWPTAAAPLEAWAPRTAPPPQPQAPPQFQAEAETAATAADGLTFGGIVPGAYLPPSSVHRPAPPASDENQPATTGGWPVPSTGTRPASPAPPQGGPWIPPTPGAPGAGAGFPPTATAASKPIVPGRTSILADLPFDAPDELEGWLVALGSGIAIVGFFLPWTASLGSGLEGYFGSWGLGIVSHLPIFIFLVIVAGLAVLPNRVASWVRTGVSGMVGGGILFGIVWLYLGSDASQLGALLAAVGAVLLIVGGIIAVAPGRAAEQREGG